MPGRPPKMWFDACVAAVEQKGGAIDPRAVCGATWKRKSQREKRTATAAESRATMRTGGSRMAASDLRFAELAAGLGLPVVSRKKAKPEKKARKKKSKRASSAAAPSAPRPKKKKKKSAAPKRPKKAKKRLHFAACTKKHARGEVCRNRKGRILGKK